jgi:hypothetical protein
LRVEERKSSNHPELRARNDPCDILRAKYVLRDVVQRTKIERSFSIGEQIAFLYRFSSTVTCDYDFSISQFSNSESAMSLRSRRHRRKQTDRVDRGMTSTTEGGIAYRTGNPSEQFDPLSSVHSENGNTSISWNGPEKVEERSDVLSSRPQHRFRFRFELLHCESSL